MANYQHTGGDPLDYHNYNLEGPDDEGCGSMIFVIVVAILLLICTVTSCTNERSTYTPRFDSSSTEQKVVEVVETIDSVCVPMETVRKEVPDSEQTQSQPASTVSRSASRTSMTTTSGSYHTDYFQMGYDDGYEDGSHLEKGRSYDNSLRGEAAREYRRGYFEGYPDGRADNDPDDEYVWGKNGADYYDLDDDEDWSENGDFDDYDDDW